MANNNKITVNENENKRSEFLAKIIERTGIKDIKLFPCSMPIKQNNIKTREDMPFKDENYWYLIAPKGDYRFSEFDTLVCDDSFCNEMISNFNNRVYQQEIPIDVDHNFGKAYGKITELKHDNEGLKAKIKFNKMGRELIEDEVYMYFSIAYADPYRSAKTSEEFNNVLVATALTNHPALKGQPEIKDNISSYSEYLDNKPECDIFNIDENKKQEEKESKKEGASMSDMEKIEIGKLKNEMDNKILEFSELKKISEEQNAKIRAEHETQINALNEEILKMKKEQRHEEIVKRMNSLTPQPGANSFILRKDDVEKYVNFAETLNHDQQESFMTLLGEMPATDMPVGEIGITGKAGEPIEVMSMDNKEIERIINDTPPGQKTRALKDFYKQNGGIK
jgi:hypothetical protein